jgi:hypothetical protein
MRCRESAYLAVFPLPLIRGPGTRPEYRIHRCPIPRPHPHHWPSPILHYTPAPQRDIRHADTCGDSGALCRDLKNPSRGPNCGPTPRPIKNISNDQKRPLLILLKKNPGSYPCNSNHNLYYPRKSIVIKVNINGLS